MKARLRNRARLFIRVWVGLLVPATVFASPKSTAQKPHTDIHARFYYAAETAYRKIELDGLKLKVSYFKDPDRKCKTWIEQRPCWTEKDLITKEARLTQRQLTDFTNLINRSGFLLLEKTYGGAKPGQRFYSELLTVKLGDVQHAVVYQSFPDAAPRPTAFKQVSDWLARLVKRNLKL